MTNRFGLAPRWILDGKGREPLEDAVVLIEDGRIVDTPSRSTITGGDWPIHDLPNMTLLPGLMDSHVHVTMSPDIADWIADSISNTDERRLLQAAANARQALESGVTTLRDLGGKQHLVFALKEAIEDGVVAGPHLVVAGAPITCPRGHCYHMGGEAANRNQIGELIASQTDRGAGVVKVMASGGGLTPGTGLTRPQFGREDLAYIVDESRRRDKPVSAHVAPTPVIRDLAEMGVDTLEHCTLLTDRGIVNDLDVMKLVKKAESYVVPTRYAFYRRRNDLDLVGGLKVEVDTTFADLWQRSVEFLQYCREFGVRIAAGSDAGIPGAYFDSVIGELEVMIIAGYTPVEAVESATSLAASALRIDGERGSIAKGLFADLLIVEGPVHEDISNLRRTRIVFLDGKPVVDRRATA